MSRAEVYFVRITNGRFLYGNGRKRWGVKFSDKCEPLLCSEMKNTQLNATTENEF